MEKYEENPDPRQHFRNDLKQFINDLRKEGHAVWLMLDANEDLNDPNSKLRKVLVDQCDMADAHAERHDPNEAPGSHIRGSKRIDYQMQAILDHSSQKLESYHSANYTEYNQTIEVPLWTY